MLSCVGAVTNQGHWQKVAPARRRRGYFICGTRHTDRGAKGWNTTTTTALAARRNGRQCLAGPTGTPWPARPLMHSLKEAAGGLVATHPPRGWALAAFMGKGEERSKSTQFVAGRLLHSCAKAKRGEMAEFVGCRLLRSCAKVKRRSKSTQFVAGRLLHSCAKAKRGEMAEFVGCRLLRSCAKVKEGRNPPNSWLAACCIHAQRQKGAKCQNLWVAGCSVHAQR